MAQAAKLTDSVSVLDPTAELRSTVRDSAGLPVRGVWMRWRHVPILTGGETQPLRQPIFTPDSARTDAQGVARVRVQITDTVTGSWRLCGTVLVGSNLIGDCMLLKVLPGPFHRIVISGNDTAAIAIGGSRKLSAFAVDRFGNAVANTRWRSLNPTVATVDSAGLVTGIGEGRAGIQATAFTESVVFHCAQRLY